MSEVDLTPLRKKKNKQAKGESGGGERVLSYAKTITHNLLPLMKTRGGERSGLDDSSAVATENECPTDTGASSSSVTPDRTKGGAMKPAWSFSNMIPKSNSKDLRHQVASKRRRKHEQAIHDTNYIDLVEPSPVLPKEDQPAGEETEETEETETESEEEREEEEERSAESSESRSRHTTSPDGTDGSDNYADASAMEDDRDGAGDVNSKAAREGGGGSDVKRKKKATTKEEKRDIKERKKEEKALGKKEKKEKKGGPVYAVLS